MICTASQRQRVWSDPSLSAIFAAASSINRPRTTNRSASLVSPLTRGPRVVQQKRCCGIHKHSCRVNFARPPRLAEGHIPDAERVRDILHPQPSGRPVHNSGRGVCVEDVVPHPEQLERADTEVGLRVDSTEQSAELLRDRREGITVNRLHILHRCIVDSGYELHHTVVAGWAGEVDRDERSMITRPIVGRGDIAALRITQALEVAIIHRFRAVPPSLRVASYRKSIDWRLPARSRDLESGRRCFL